MAKLKQRIKRTLARLERKIAPKNSIIITRAIADMLSKHEAQEVLGSIRNAQRTGRLPSLSYSFGTLSLAPSIFSAVRGRLYFKPENTKILAETAVKVRRVLKQQFGNKYKVRLGSGL